MKNIFYVLVFVVSSVIACNCSGSGYSSSAGADSVSGSRDAQPIIDSASADTLARLLGTLVGNDVSVARRTAFLDSSYVEFNNADFMRGVDIALTPDAASSSYTEGVRAAKEILMKIEDFKQYGININREILLRAIETQLFADSISDADMAKLNSEYNVLLQRAYEK